MSPPSDSPPFPPAPEKPLDSDCCGQGCTPCVFDLYDQDLAMWKRKCEQLDDDDGDDDDQDYVAMRPDAYLDLELLEILPVTSDTNIYRFGLAGGVGRLRDVGQPGQHLVLKQRTDANTILTRQYTVLDPSHSKGTLDVLIKLYPGGRMSDYIRRWLLGDLVPWRGPFGHFRYTRSNNNSFKRIAFVGIGTGISPLLSVAREILLDEDDETWLNLYLGFSSSDDILLKDRLAEMSLFWNVRMTLYLSREDKHEQEEKKRCRFAQLVLSRMTPNLVRNDLIQRENCDLKEVLFLVCGTKTFEKEFKTWLEGEGENIPSEHIVLF